MLDPHEIRFELNSETEPGGLPTEKFDLAFQPQENEFNGKRSVQLKVLDWREAVS